MRPKLYTVLKLYITVHQIKEEEIGEKYCTNHGHGRSVHRILYGQP
jgi:hypothetical protein